MTADASSIHRDRSVGRSLVRDPFLLVALGIVGTAQALYRWPPFQGRPSALWAGHIADPVFLVVAIAALLWKRPRPSHREERWFWRLILTTMILWLAGNLASLASGLWGGPTSRSIPADLLYLLSYVAAILSADLRPHLPSRWTRSAIEFRFAAAASVLAVIGTIGYFFALPLLQVTPTGRDSSIEYTFLALDILLAIRFAHLWYRERHTAWAGCYACLLMAFLSAAAADALNIVESSGALPVGYGTPLDIVWWLAFVAVIAARGARGSRPVPDSAADPGEVLRTDANEILFVYALLFPVTHLLLEAFGSGVNREPGGQILVLSALFSFFALAIAQQRLQERRNRELRSVIRGHVTQEQVVQSQKLEAIGRLAGGLAHDFNNLLTVVMGRAESLVAKVPPGTARRDVAEILQASERGAALTQQLLAFSRSQVLRARSLDLNVAIQDAEPVLRRLIGERHAIVTELNPGLRMIEGEPGQIFQILLNLIANARDAMPSGGTVHIRTYPDVVRAGDPDVEPPSAGGEFVAMDVEDAGVGMDTSTRQRMFDPFFTSKSSGTGLGLAVVHGIVAQGKGHVRVRSQIGSGSTLTILFPHAESAASAEHLPATRMSGAGARRTVLLVEDQPAVRGSVRSLLEALEYGVIEAGNGAEALAACAAPSQPDILLTDVVMPGMRGPELARAVRERCPGIGVVLMSGYVNLERDEPLDRHPEDGFLTKPFRLEDLRRALDGVPAGPRAES